MFQRNRQGRVLQGPRMPAAQVGTTKAKPLVPVPPEMFGLRKLLPTAPEYDFNVHVMDFAPGHFLVTKVARPPASIPAHHVPLLPLSSDVRVHTSLTSTSRLLLDCAIFDCASSLAHHPPAIIYPPQIRHPITTDAGTCGRKGWVATCSHCLQSICYSLSHVGCRCDVTLRVHHSPFLQHVYTLHAFSNQKSAMVSSHHLLHGDTPLRQPQLQA